MKNQREINGNKQTKKLGPRKSDDVAGDMLDKGDKETIAPTRHARPIKIKKNQNAPSLDLLSIPQSGGKNIKTFRWDQRLQIQNIFHGI